MKSTKKFIIHTIVLGVLFALAASLRFSTSHEKIPADCDEFGYLNLAKSFNTGKTFDNHSPRPYFLDLIKEFKKNNIPEIEYKWMLTPHAYHFSEELNNKIINQYPPGTSFVLSWIPIKLRKMSFPFLVVLCSFIFPLLICNYFFKNNNGLLLLIILSFLMVLFSISTPFLTELARINSLGLTFCLFISAGILIFKKPHISLFLVFIAANFRVVNLLMVFPLFIYILYIIVTYYKENNIVQAKSVLVKSIIYPLVGISPYLLYVVLLLGNPFIPTYPSHDLASHEVTNLLSNLNFYINFNQPWFIVHVIALVILIVQYRFKLLSFFNLSILLLFPLINYIFFIFHKVQMDYYPFASSFILIGACIYNLKVIELNKKYIYIPYIFALIMCIDGVNRYINKEHINFKEAKDSYSTLCNYDIVWGETFCGTSEYICDNNGFKFAFGTKKSRVIALKYLQKNNYKQAILLNDIALSKQEILETIISSGLTYNIIEDDKIGQILIVN